MCGRDNDGFGGKEKERKTEAEVDGQSKCGLEGERISGEQLCRGNLSLT